MGLLRHRRRPKWRPLDEAEAYARCHGQRNEDVKIVHLEPRRPRYKPHVSGERLREAFEQRLNAREPEEPLEPREQEAGPDAPAPVLEQLLALPPNGELVELDATSGASADGEVAL